MAVSDNHLLWRVVKRNRDALQEQAPPGYETIVVAYLAGRAEPVVVSQVETRRDQPWILLYSNGPTPDRGKSHHDDQLVFVHQGQLLRVEAIYERVGDRRPGFDVRVLDSGDPTIGAA